MAAIFGGQVQERLTLGGDGGGVFELDSRGGVTLSVTRANTAGPPAAEVTDALAGRSTHHGRARRSAASSRAALARMADFSTHPPNRLGAAGET